MPLSYTLSYTFHTAFNPREFLSQKRIRPPTISLANYLRLTLPLFLKFMQQDSIYAHSLHNANSHARISVATYFCPPHPLSLGFHTIGFDPRTVCTSAADTTGHVARFKQAKNLKSQLAAQSAAYINYKADF